MNLLNSLLDVLRRAARSLMRRLAQFIDKTSGGRVTANTVTYTSLLFHIPIVYLIAGGELVAAGILLIIFGLFDTLDGELARLQKKASPLGMFVDSATDRLKEALLYIGIVAYFLNTSGTSVVLVAVGALSVSLITSYLNAWGEVALANYKKSKDHQVNKTLRSGFLGLELRMGLLVIGLLFNQLEAVVYVILVLGGITVLQRYFGTIQRLKA